jgi:hypothetical protein
MRVGFWLCALVVPASFITTAPAPSAAAESEKDTCSMLTHEQLSDAVGTSMNAGTYTMQGVTHTCTWTLASGATPAVKYLTLDLQAASAYDSAKSLDAQANPTSVAELGDEAYFVNFNGLSIATLRVKKGDAAFKLTWYGVGDSQAMMTAEKTLASHVLSNL